VTGKDGKDKDLDGGQTAETRKWVAWRDAVRADAARYESQARAERDARDRQIKEDYHNPAAIWIGLAVLAALVVTGWFIVDRLTCDPMYSDLGMSHSRACR